MKKLLFLLIALLSISFIACSDDEGSTAPVVEVDAWVGTWLSAGDNVPSTVSSLGIDSARFTMNEDQTLTLESHFKDGQWIPTVGTYSVTESSSGDIHSIEIVYPSYEQGGIIQVIKGNPDKMKLEVVATVPNYGFTPVTPEGGFGSSNLGDINIQTYVKVD